jgi:hypothetical protein
MIINEFDLDLKLYKYLDYLQNLGEDQGDRE